MKKEINYFIRTYFYFNHKERKGLFSLLGLVIFLQAGTYLFARYRQNGAPEIQFLPFEKLDSTFLAKSAFNENKPDSFTYLNTQNGKLNIRSPKLIGSNKKPSQFQSLELNEADSESLVKLPKIGPVMASRIIQYRNKLGGFHSLNQLTEIWGFKEDLLFDLEGKIYINEKRLSPIYINKVELEKLKTHPYFKYTLSNAIVNYRKAHGNFSALEDLKNIKLVSDSIYQLILPYCRIE